MNIDFALGTLFGLLLYWMLSKVYDYITEVKG